MTKSLNFKQSNDEEFIAEAQIVKVIKEHKGGRDLNDICRKLAIHKSTIYNWRKKYAGMSSQEWKWLKELEEENRKLKYMDAELALDYSLLKDDFKKSEALPAQGNSCLLNGITAFRSSSAWLTVEL